MPNQSAQLPTDVRRQLELLRLEVLIELKDGQLRLVKWVGAIMIIQTWVVVLAKTI